MIFLPRVTAQNTPEPQIKTFKDAIFFYGLFGIFGAGRIKDTTGFFENREMFLIKINEFYEVCF